MKKIDKIRTYLVVIFIVIGIVIGGLEKAKENSMILGSGEGFNDDIVLKIGFDKDLIDSIKVVSHSETPGISDEAFNELIPSIIEAQNINVDDISGATYTSVAIKKAIEDAAKKAGIGKFVLIGEIEENITEFIEGKLIGIGEGFYGDIEVEVILKDGIIEDIAVLSHEDTEAVGEPAMEKLREQIVSEQSIEIDFISGASFTSEGYLDAVRGALDALEGSNSPSGLIGVGEGFYGDIEVEVLKDGEEILDILLLSHEDTEDIALPAIEELKKTIIEEQSIDVDIISGATFTSEGYINAVDSAIN